MTSRTRRNAASANIAAWRIGTDMTAAVEAAGGLPESLVGALGVCGRDDAWDDCRHRGTFRVGGS
ncbi:hypothetical protein LRC537489_49660 [Mycobacterium riyadhense]